MKILILIFNFNVHTGTCFFAFWEELCIRLTSTVIWTQSQVLIFSIEYMFTLQMHLLYMFMFLETYFLTISDWYLSRIASIQLETIKELKHTNTNFSTQDFTSILINILMRVIFKAKASDLQSKFRERHTSHS